MKYTYRYTHRSQQCVTKFNCHCPTTDCLQDLPFLSSPGTYSCLLSLSTPALPPGLQPHVLIHKAKWPENRNFSPRSSIIFGPVYKHFFLPTIGTIFHLLILGNKFGKVQEYCNKHPATWNCQMLTFSMIALSFCKRFRNKEKLSNSAKTEEPVKLHSTCCVFRLCPREFLHSSIGPTGFGEERARKQGTERPNLRMPPLFAP